MGWFEILNRLALNSRWIERIMIKKKKKEAINVKLVMHLAHSPPHRGWGTETFQMPPGNAVFGDQTS
jgi:hypothetical protein